MSTLLEVEDLKKHYVLAGQGPSNNPLVRWVRSHMTSAQDHTPVLHAVDGVSRCQPGLTAPGVLR